MWPRALTVPKPCGTRGRDRETDKERDRERDRWKQRAGLDARNPDTLPERGGERERERETECVCVCPRDLTDLLCPMEEERVCVSEIERDCRFYGSGLHRLQRFRAFLPSRCNNRLDAKGVFLHGQQD